MNDTHTNHVASDRAVNLVARQECLVSLVSELGQDGLLLLDPVNFAWFTGGAGAKGVLDPADYPGIYLQNSQRWLLCSNVDTQRLFDEDLDSLGFQLKEWPWYWGRAQLLADLCHGKKAASDVPFGECPVAAEQIRTLRRALNAAAQATLMNIGKAVAHALEATCRNLERGESEEEVAGQLAHRLVHRGLEPISIQVAADGRMNGYRRPGISAAGIEHTCVIQTTARKSGLHATASRTVSFGPPDDGFRNAMDASCRLTAVQIAASTAGADAAFAMRAAQQIIEPMGFEHEWRLSPVGWVTGYAAVETPLAPRGGHQPAVRIQVREQPLPQEPTMLFEAGWALTWQGSIGPSACADTMLVTEAGPQIVTPSELWPVKRIRVSGKVIERPDILMRD